MLQFNLGLNDSLNNIDPTTVETTHPLTTYNNMWWSWATKFIFYKLEGKFDNNNDNTPDANMLYHVGGSAYNKPVELSKSITITKGDTTYYEIDLDIYKILTKTENLTHTMDNPTVAAKIAQQYAKAFSAP